MKNKIKYCISFIFICIIFTILIGVFDDMSTSPKVKGDILIWANERTYEYLNSSAEKFMATNNKANIRVVKIYDYEYVDKLEQAFETKSLPSIIQVQSRDFYNIVLDESKRNMLIKENSIIEDYSKNFTSARLEEITIDGDVLGVPLTSSPLVLYLREDMLNEYGYTNENINTWDDFVSMGKDINEKSGGKVKVLNATREDYKDLVSLLIMQSLEEVQSRGKVESSKQIIDMVNGKLAYLTENNILNSKDGEQFLARISSVNGMRELASLDVPCSWVACKVPARSTGGNRAYVGEGDNLVIVDESEENKELIRRFIGFLSSNSEGAVKYVKEGEFFSSYLSTYKNKTIEEPIKNFAEKSPLVIMSNITEKAPEIKDYKLYIDIKKEFFNQ